MTEWVTGDLEYRCADCGTECSIHREMPEAKVRLCSDCFPPAAQPTADSPGWPSCIAFRCRSCKEHAIEESGTGPAEARECYKCYRIPDLETAPEDPAELSPSPRPEPIPAPAEEPEAAPRLRGVDPAAEAASPPAGAAPRESDAQHDRRSTQRTRPGSPPATQAGSPVSRPVDRRDSGD